MTVEIPQIRISKIAGRYLLFSPEAVSLLRRTQNTNGTLVGTLPQQPTQNIFLGLPIEIRPEEAATLVAKGAAYVVDDVAAHAVALRSGHSAAYIETLKRSKATAQKVLKERENEKKAQAKGRFNVPIATQPDDSSRPADLAVTLTSSDTLLTDAQSREFEVSDVPAQPLASFLQAGGYYMTPGLRFGARYSVYPGDPLRFHAHFMANHYDWNESIPILDIVEGGRLATAVKKSFLIGGEDGGGEDVRAYCIEWAGM